MTIAPLGSGSSRSSVSSCDGGGNDGLEGAQPPAPKAVTLGGTARVSVDLPGFGAPYDASYDDNPQSCCDRFWRAIFRLFARGADGFTSHDIVCSSGYVRREEGRSRGWNQRIQSMFSACHCPRFNGVVTACGAMAAGFTLRHMAHMNAGDSVATSAVGCSGGDEPNGSSTREDKTQESPPPSPRVSRLPSVGSTTV